MGALIPLFIQYLPQLIKAAETIPEIIGFIHRTKATLATTVEWTPEIQAKYDEELERVTSQPWWKPDAETSSQP